MKILLLFLFNLIGLISFSQDLAFKINGGTQLRLINKNELAGTSVTLNQIIEFELVSDIYFKNEVLLSKGLKAKGTITFIEEKKSSAKNVKFDFTIDSVLLKDGRSIKLKKATEGNGYEKKDSKFNIIGKLESLVKNQETKYLAGTEFYAVVENDFIVKYGYSSSAVNTIIEAFRNSKSNYVYDYYYNKSAKFSPYNNISNANNNQKSIGYLGDKEYVESSESSFSLSTVFNKFLKATNEKDRDNYFISLFNYIYYGNLPQNYDGTAPNDMPRSIRSEMFPGNGHTRSSEFKYTYIKELGIFFIEGRDGEYYAFDPIYGALQFLKDPNGFKLTRNQENAVKIDVIKENYLTKQKDPRQKYSYYELPSKYYVVNPSGSYPNSGYTLRVKTDGSTYIDHLRLPQYGYINISSKESTDYKLGEDYYTISGEKEYKYYPSYEEKLAVFKIGGLPAQDLQNPNFYYLKKESDRKVFFYNLLNNNGHKIIPINYSQITSMGNNFFITKIENKFGVIEITSKSLRSGKFRIYDNVFEEIVDNLDGTITAKINNKKMILDLFGNEIKK